MPCAPSAAGGPKPPPKGDAPQCGVRQPGARAEQRSFGSELFLSGPERPLFGPELFLEPVQREQFSSESVPLQAEREAIDPEMFLPHPEL